MCSLVQTFYDLRPLDGFGLIMADPPWAFQTRSAKGVTSKGAGGQYRLMKLEDIKAMPVSILAADDSVLWLWATNPMLREAIAVMDAWGFTFKTAGHWAKRTPKGKLAFGTGYVANQAVFSQSSAWLQDGDDATLVSAAGGTPDDSVAVGADGEVTTAPDGSLGFT